MKNFACGACTWLLFSGIAILLLSLLAVSPATALIEPVNSEIRPAAETEGVQPLSTVDKLTMPEVDMVKVSMEDEIADQLN